MSPSQDLCCYLTEGNINSDFIIEAIDDFARTVNKPTVIVLDNATWHTSKKVRARAAEWERQGVFIFYLPTYRPHLNPIEILWRKINGAAAGMSGSGRRTTSLNRRSGTSSSTY